MAGYQPVHQFLAQHQGEKGAEDVAADGRIGSMKDRPCGQQRLSRKETLLHGQQVPVAQHHLQGSQLGIGAQHKQTVITSFSLDLRSIDGKALTRWLGKEAAVSSVADQRFVALCQLAFETGQQGGPRLGVLAGLFRVAGQHIATPSRGRRP